MNVERHFPTDSNRLMAVCRKKSS